MKNVTHPERTALNRSSASWRNGAKETKEYLIDDELLFTGDSIALNRDGGWCFFDIINYDSKMNMASLQALRNKLDLDRIRYVFTSHNGFTHDPQSAFRHVDTIPALEKGRPFDETVPYDCFAEKGE